MSTPTIEQAARQMLVTAHSAGYGEQALGFSRFGRSRNAPVIVTLMKSISRLASGGTRAVTQRQTKLNEL